MSRERDLVANVDMSRAAQSSMAVIDALQHTGPGEQLAAAAVVFKLAAERAGIQAADLLVYAGNIMNHADGRRAEFRAVEAYMEGEWK